MKRMKIALLATTMVMAIAQPAAAESQTVQGQGDLTKMVAKNNQSAAIVKLFGLGEPCGGAQHLNAHVIWGSTSAYMAEAGCYSGNTWGKGFYYLSDRSKPESAKEVNCPDFKISYNAADEFYKIFIPRSCMPKAANRVKFKSTGQNFGTMTGGTAGPTRLLARG
jgi:hypothetical protein